MVPDTATSQPADSAATSDDPNTVLNVLLGGVVGVVLSFIPLSPLLGGAVAGYLEEGSQRDGLKVGALAGLLMLIPVAFIGFFLLFLLGLGGAPAAIGILGFVVLLVSALYTVGLSAMGGVLGNYLVDEL